jgi:putative N6-adenine-specific DNA methylase
VEYPYTAAALCAAGAERVLGNELRKLGFSLRNSSFGKIRFTADRAGLYRALMALRTADRVLLETAFFPAGDFEALFEGAAGIPWEEYIPRNMGLRVVKVRTTGSRLSAETSIQAVVHKAAARRLCSAYGMERLPDRGPAAEIRVYIEKDQVSLLLDLSGEPLFKRGYRTEGGPAPLRETTAAGLLLLAGWRRKFPLYDPFCGSGTILIEAAMYAWDMAPGLGRHFALEKLSIACRDAEEAVRQELRGRINFERTIRIAGSDADGRAVSLARANAERAFELAQGKPPVRGLRVQTPRLPCLPDMRKGALADARPPAGTDSGDGKKDEAAGFIITNPPYGRRLGEPEDAERVYAEMAALGRFFPGWKLGCVTDHPGFESFFGRKASSCKEIINGAAASYFFQYGKL